MLPRWPWLASRRTPEHRYNLYPPTPSMATASRKLRYGFVTGFLASERNIAIPSEIGKCHSHIARLRTVMYVPKGEFPETSVSRQHNYVRSMKFVSCRNTGRELPVTFFNSSRSMVDFNGRRSTVNTLPSSSQPAIFLARQLAFFPR